MKRVPFSFLPILSPGGTAGDRSMCGFQHFPNNMYAFSFHVFMLGYLKMNPSSSVASASSVPGTAVSCESSVSPQDGSLCQRPFLSPLDKQGAQALSPMAPTYCAPVTGQPSSLCWDDRHRPR